MKEYKCKIYHYRYDISEPEQNQQYKKEVLKAKKLSQWNKPNITHWINFTYRYKEHKEYCDKIRQLKTVTIETKFLFDNQFNTKEGYRMYNWHEWEYRNKDIKEGYYIDIPQEYFKLLDTTYKCGYCGKQYTKQEKDKKDFTFCDSCLDSEYLTKDNLFLLRLKRINDKTERVPLNDCDKQVLEEQYTQSQIFGTKKRGIERFKKLRQKIKDTYKKDTLKAKTEYKGKMWLLNNKINIDNLIYYSHTNTFCFGWRKPLSFEEEQELKKVIEYNEKDKFPYKYEIKT